MIRAATNAILDRRRLLFGLAAATTAAAVPAIAAGAAPVTEDPELLRLGDILKEIITEHRGSVDAYEAILAEWMPRWPRAPEIIKGGDEVERNMEGAGYGLNSDPNDYRCAHYQSARNLQWSIDHARRSLARSRKPESRARAAAELAEVTPLYEAALAFEAEKQRILDASGFEAARQRKAAAEEALSAHVFLVLGQQPKTMEGVLIHAQAVDAVSNGCFDWISAVTFQLKARSSYGKLLAASLLRFAEEGGAGKS